MKFKFPIAWKLLFVTVFILLLAMIPVAYKVSDLFSDLSLKREEDINKEQTLAKSSEIISKLEDILDKSFVVGSLIYRDKEILKDRKSKAVNKTAIDFNLERLREIYRVSVYKLNFGKKPTLVSEVLNTDVLVKYEIPQNYHTLIDKQAPFPFLIPFNDVVSVKNRSLSSERPILTIGAPLVKANSKVTHIVVADFAFSSLQKSLINQGYRNLYIVDNDGELLAHSDENTLNKGSDYLDLGSKEHILKAIDSKAHAGQFYYKDASKNAFYAAYAKTPFGITVFSETSESVIKEPALLAAKQVAYITSTVLFASLIIIFLFSKHLTKPIAKLANLMFKIGEGKFNVKAKNIIKSHDEVGDLAHWFDHMVEGLKERDRVKQLFSKFQGSQIAENLLSEDFEMQSTGNSRSGVVFFSDIRGFTSYSEEKDPAEVVSMLNEYFTIMVKILGANYGVVDKFIGDAVMAVWGAPKSTGKDCYYAVRACLEMREGLTLLNKRRTDRGEAPIKIGMGLHYGELVAGIIGSDDRMEYTVIGDTVNVASRIESETKNQNVDFLISEQVYEQVKDDFNFIKKAETTLKGKEKATVLYTIA